MGYTDGVPGGRLVANPKSPQASSFDTNKGSSEKLFQKSSNFPNLVNLLDFFSQYLLV